LQVSVKPAAVLANDYVPESGGDSLAKLLNAGAIAKLARNSFIADFKPIELAEQWEQIEPFLPQRVRSARGGRPPADDRAWLEGVLWLLRSGARWRGLPERYPLPSTCRRRLVKWEGEDVLVTTWQAFSA